MAQGARVRARPPPPPLPCSSSTRTATSRTPASRPSCPPSCAPPPHPASPASLSTAPPRYALRSHSNHLVYGETSVGGSLLTAPLIYARAGGLAPGEADGRGSPRCRPLLRPAPMVRNRQSLAASRVAQLITLSGCLTVVGGSPRGRRIGWIRSGGSSLKPRKRLLGR